MSKVIKNTILLILLSLFIISCDNTDNPISSNQDNFDPQKYLTGIWDIDKQHRWKKINGVFIIDRTDDSPPFSETFYSSEDFPPTEPYRYVYNEHFDDSTFIQHQIESTGDYHYVVSGVLSVDENSYNQTFYYQDGDELVEMNYNGELEIDGNLTYIYSFEFEIDSVQYLGKNYWVKRVVSNDE